MKQEVNSIARGCLQHMKHSAKAAQKLSKLTPSNRDLVDSAMHYQNMVKMYHTIQSHHLCLTMFQVVSLLRITDAFKILNATLMVKKERSPQLRTLQGLGVPYGRMFLVHQQKVFVETVYVIDLTQTSQTI